MSLILGLHQDLHQQGYADARDSAIAAAASVNCQVSRTGLLWAIVEETEGVYDWSRLDDVIADVKAAGMKIMVTPFTSPAWANGTTGDPDPAVVPTDPTEFDAWVTAYANFLTDVANRHADSIDYWEMWNEPNLTPFWKPAPDTDQYIAWYEACYAAIRAVDPSAVIAGPGLSSPIYVGGTDISGRDFLQAMYDAEVYPDIVCTHLYPVAPPGVDVPFDASFRDIAEEAPSLQGGGDTNGLYGVMVANGEGDTPLWVTEMSWGIGVYAQSPTDAAEQANYFRAALTILRDEMPYVEMFIWFIDYDRGAWDGFGLFDENFSRKPIADVFAEGVPAVALIDSAVAYWKAAGYSGSGDLLDGSGNGHDLTPQGSPSFADGVFTLDGLDDLFYLADHADFDFDTDEDATFLILVSKNTSRSESWDPGATQYLASKGYTNAFWRVLLDPSGDWLLAESRDSGSGVSDSEFSIATAADDTVNIIALRRVSNAVEAVCDGAGTGSPTAADGDGDIRNAAEFMIGATGDDHTSVESFFKGRFYGAALWRSEISDGDLATAAAELQNVTGPGAGIAAYRQGVIHGGYYSGYRDAHLYR